MRYSQDELCSVVDVLKSSKPSEDVSFKLVDVASMVAARDLVVDSSTSTRRSFRPWSRLCSHVERWSSSRTCRNRDIRPHIC